MVNIMMLHNVEINNDDESDDDGVEFVDKNERTARPAFKRAEKAGQSL